MLETAARVVLLMPVLVLAVNEAPILAMTVTDAAVAVAFADIVIVVPLIDVMVVAVELGMPLPVMVCPTANPVMLDTDVRLALPLVVVAVNEGPRVMVTPVPAAVAPGDIVIEEPLIAVMVVPAAMPVPVMGCPTTNAGGNDVPAVFDTFVMIGLPAVTIPTTLTRDPVEAVAFFDSVIEVGPIVVMVVLAGMPVPLIGLFTVVELLVAVLAASPARLDSAETTALPLARTPVGAIVLVPPVITGFVITIVKSGALAGPPVDVPAKLLMVLPAGMASPVVVMLSVAVLDRLLVAVAAADIVIVVPLIAAMVAPVAMPLPERGCPTASPTRLDTDVRRVLPEVALAVNEVVKGLPVLVRVSGVAMVAVAGCDSVIVVPLNAAMVVPVGMPVPTTVCPNASPVRLDTDVRRVLPEVVMAVNGIPLAVMVSVGVATADITTVTPLIAAMVVPARMPVPVTVCPTTSPTRFDTNVRRVLPEVVMAVNVPVNGVPVTESPVLVTVSGVVMVAVAGADSVIVRPRPGALIAPMVVPARMPVPVTVCPTTSPVRLDTDVRRVLPEVVLAVNMVLGLVLVSVMVTAVAVAVAGADSVIVRPRLGLGPLIGAMVIPAGMPVPLRGCPAANPARFDTFVRRLLPAVGSAWNETGARVMGCPAVSPLVVLTPVMVALPAVR
jgi:hypothetical protein